MFKGRFHNFAVLVIVGIFIAIGLWGHASAQEPVEPPYAGPFAVGNQFCPLAGNPECNPPIGSTYPNTCNLVTPRHMAAAPSSVPYQLKMGWTSQLFRPGNSADYEDLMCAGIPYQDICPPSPGIWGIPGTSDLAFGGYKSLMYDPLFDQANKSCLTADLKCHTSSDTVTDWTVLIPVVDREDPMSAPDPNPVWGYALVHISAVCATGSMAGCPSRPTPPNNNSIPGCGVGENSSIIDQISCLPCVGSSYISVNPISFDFGNIVVGTSSTPQTWSILNDGTGVLAIYPLQINGTHYSEFSIQNDTCSGKILMPSENCTVDIAFSPETEGEKLASLSLSSNDPDTPTLDMPLSGTGIPLVECSLVPDWPIVVQGGDLEFQGTITDNTDKSGSVLFATAITLPSGNRYPPYGYLIGPLQVYLNSYQSKSGHRSQHIPHYAPLGTYTYHGYVGRYDMGILAECQFNFTVNQQGQGCNLCHQ
jgi:hypothetical protein